MVEKQIKKPPETHSDAQDMFWSWICRENWEPHRLRDFHHGRVVFEVLFPEGVLGQARNLNDAKGLNADPEAAMQLKNQLLVDEVTLQSDGRKSKMSQHGSQQILL